MRNLVVILISAITIVSVFLPRQAVAQSPENISYQAVIRNSGNTPIVNTAIAMQISIVQGSIDGSAVYIETQTTTTNAYGLISVEIGSGSVVSGSFAAINWSSGPYYIKTEIDPAGGTNYTITGTSRILSVPYALYAKSAANGFSGNYADLTNKPVIPSAANGSETKLTAGANLTVSGEGTTSNPYTVNLADGTVAGQMLYWNGSAWVVVSPGHNGQILKYVNGAPTWSDKSLNELVIGDYYQGGIVAYFLQSGDAGYEAGVRHGLIAAPQDQSTDAVWGCNGTSIPGASGTVIGTGRSNTATILSNCSESGIAAKVCDDLVLNGYDDWFLPSKDELAKLYENRTAIGGFSGMDYYWSSSESYSNAAWYVFFNNGNLDAASKTSAIHVRAIRTF